MYWDENGQGHLWAPTPNSDKDTAGWRKFRHFDDLNPQVWEEFTKRTLEAYRSGGRRLGAQLILEVLRWDNVINPTREDRFKLNNDWAAFYARKFMLQYPQCEGIFELRALRR